LAVVVQIRAICVRPNPRLTLPATARFCRWQDVAGIGDLTGTAAAIGLDLRRECSVAAGSRIAVKGVSLMA